MAALARPRRPHRRRDSPAAVQVLRELRQRKMLGPASPSEATDGGADGASARPRRRRPAAAMGLRPAAATSACTERALPLTGTAARVCVCACVNAHSAVSLFLSLRVPVCDSGVLRVCVCVCFCV
jgi:hypothetical protein